MAQHQPPFRAKLYIAYDRYVLQQPHGEEVVHEAPGMMTVPQFRQRSPVTCKINSKKLDSRGFCVLLGQRSHGWFYVASEKGKKFSRSLLETLQRIESEGFIIQDFEDHIRVFRDGEVKLRGIRLVSRDDLGIDKAAFELLRRENYEVARTVIHNLFNHNGRTVPADIMKLLNLMTYHPEPVMRRLYPIHASLKPLGLSPSAFKDLHDVLQLNINDLQYQRICTAVACAFTGDWRDIVRKSDLLLETYNFRGSGAEYELPSNTPNQTHRTADQNRALNAVGITAPEFTNVLSPNELVIIDGHLLLKFLRNRLAHRAEAIDNGYYTWNHGMQRAFTTLHSELVILVHFPKVLATVQFELHLIRQPLLVNLI